MQLTQIQDITIYKPVGTPAQPQCVKCVTQRQVQSAYQKGCHLSGVAPIRQAALHGSVAPTAVATVSGI